MEVHGDPRHAADDDVAVCFDGNGFRKAPAPAVVVEHRLRCGRGVYPDELGSIDDQDVTAPLDGQVRRYVVEPADDQGLVAVPGIDADQLPRVGVDRDDLAPEPDIDLAAEPADRDGCRRSRRRRVGSRARVHTTCRHARRRDRG